MSSETLHLPSSGSLTPRHRRRYVRLAPLLALLVLAPATLLTDRILDLLSPRTESGWAGGMAGEEGLNLSPSAQLDTQLFRQRITRGGAPAGGAPGIEEEVLPDDEAGGSSGPISDALASEDGGTGEPGPGGTSGGGDGLPMRQMLAAAHELYPQIGGSSGEGGGGGGGGISGEGGPPGDDNPIVIPPDGGNGDGDGDGNNNPTRPVPEPGTLALLALGAGVAGVVRRRRR